VGVSLDFLLYYFIVRGFHWGAYHSISLLLDISLGCLSFYIIATGYFIGMPIILYHCWVGVSLGSLFYHFIARGFHWCLFYYIIAGWVFHWDAYSIISLLGGYFIGVLIILYHCCMGISLGSLFYHFIARGFHWDAYSIISLLGGHFIGVSILLFHC